MGDFFTSKQDLQLAKNIVSKSVDLYVRPLIETGTAVLDKSTPGASTLTPAVSPGWTIDEHIGKLVVYGGREFIVVSNTADLLVIDLEEDVDTNDFSADYVDTNTYNYQLWDTEEFLGYADDTEFSDEEDTKNFTTGLPKEEVREDLVQRTVSMNTVIRIPSPGLNKAVHNLDDTDSNSIYHVLQGGSNPGARPFFYITAKGENVNSKSRWLRGFKTQFKPNGATSMGGTDDDYENIPATISFKSDTDRPTNRNYYSARTEK